MFNFKRFCVIPATVIILTAGVNLYASEPKIGFVDLQKVLLNSTRGKKAKEILAAEFEERKEHLIHKQEELDKLESDLKKQRLILEEDTLKEKEGILDEKRKKFQSLYQKYDLGLRKKDAELTQNILSDIEGVIKTIAEREGFSLVLERIESSILYAEPKMDITDKVIKAYNEMLE